MEEKDLRRNILQIVFFSLLLIVTFIYRTVKADELDSTQNGANSDNTIIVNERQTTTVQQSNNQSADTTSNSDAQTGANQTSNTTSGTTTLQTGDVVQQTDISNQGNVNVSAVSPTPTSQVTASINGNGAGSFSTIIFDQKTETSVNGSNNTSIETHINSQSSTGGNNVNGNTGGGVSVQTGSVNNNISIHNDVNKNIRTFEPSESPAPNSEQSHIHIDISNNGSGSQNSVSIRIQCDRNIVMNNLSFINNLLDTKYETGGNYLNGNTASSVSLITGNSFDTSFIANKTNLNSSKVTGCQEVNILQPPVTPSPTSTASPQPTSSASSSPGSTSTTPPSSGGGGTTNSGSSGGGGSSANSTSATSNRGSGSPQGEVLGVNFGGIFPETGSMLNLVDAFLLLLALGILVMDQNTHIDDLWQRFKQNLTLMHEM